MPNIRSHLISVQEMSWKKNISVPIISPNKMKKAMLHVIKIWIHRTPWTALVDSRCSWSIVSKSFCQLWRENLNMLVKLTSAMELDWLIFFFFFLQLFVGYLRLKALAKTWVDLFILDHGFSIFFLKWSLNLYYTLISFTKLVK